MGRQKRKGLSNKQKTILWVLEDFRNRNGYPPAIREICNQANISSTSVVNYYLEQLEEMGYIERDQGVSRGIRLLKTAEEPVSPIPSVTEALNAVANRTVSTVNRVQEAVANMLQVPLVGRIGASLPVPTPSTDFSYYDAESMVDVAASLLPKGEKGDKLFALEVQGDSMIDAMVYDGDIVVMKPTGEARNGEMVAVWLTDRDETTLKYFYKEKDRIRLQPANPTMGPIYIDDPKIVQVQGKVVMVIRQVNGLAS